MISRIVRLAIVFILFFPGNIFAQSLRVSPVVKAVRKSEPAVVNISTEKVVSMQGFNRFGNDWIYNFFAPYHRRNVKRQSLGSGVLIRANGTILTNEHVILPASKITVTTSNGNEYSAELLGASRRFDLAILKLDAPRAFPFLTPGNSDDIMIGETVIAIGNPFGLSSTVTTGVVSAKDRTLTLGDSNSSRGQTYYGLIQTDASINPGNSGGPLLNILGELIGINTAIYADAQGIGFAIPINKAKNVIDDLIRKGEVPRIWIGIQVQQLTDMLARHLNIKSTRGVLVSEVRKGSPGKTAGISPGDVILSINGQTVPSPESYWNFLSGVAPGDDLKLQVIHHGRKRTIHVQAIAFPESRSEELAWELVGLSVRKISNRLIREYRLQVNRGVFVNAVRLGSPAEEVGIKKGDVILQVDRHLIGKPSDFFLAVRDAVHQDTITLVVVRHATSYRVTLGIM